jgi:hypothetical protein
VPCARGSIWCAEGASVRFSSDPGQVPGQCSDAGCLLSDRSLSSEHGTHYAWGGPGAGGTAQPSNAATSLLPHAVEPPPLRSVTRCICPREHRFAGGSNTRETQDVVFEYACPQGSGPFAGPPHPGLRRGRLWLAELLTHGLARGSLVPDQQTREMHNLLHTRKQLVRERSSHIQRLQKV